MSNKEAVRQELAYIGDLAKDLARDFGAAEVVGFTRSNNFQGEGIRGSGTSDPTGEIVVSRFHADARRSIKRAEKRIRDARLALQDSYSALAHVFGPGGTDNSVGGGRLTKHELDELRAQQAKRAARGEEGY